jgi:hypothetical protein
MITLQDVQQIIDMRGLVFPYPRKGMVSINGGRMQPATKEAIKAAQAYCKALLS